MKNAPKTIFLNIGSTKGDESEDFKDQKDVTWSEEQVNPMDIEYSLVEQQPTGEVTADEAEEASFWQKQTSIIKLEKELAQYKTKAEAAEQRVKELEEALLCCIGRFDGLESVGVVIPWKKLNEIKELYLRTKP